MFVFVCAEVRVYACKILCTTNIHPHKNYTIPYAEAPTSRPSVRTTHPAGKEQSAVRRRCVPSRSVREKPYDRRQRMLYYIKFDDIMYRMFHKLWPARVRVELQVCMLANWFVPARSGSGGPIMRSSQLHIVSVHVQSSNRNDRLWLLQHSV